MGVTFERVSLRTLLVELRRWLISWLAQLVAAFLKPRQDQRHLRRKRSESRARDSADRTRSEAFLDVFEQVRSRYEELLGEDKDFQDLITTPRRTSGPVVWSRPIATCWWTSSRTSPRAACAAPGAEAPRASPSSSSATTGNRSTASPAAMWDSCATASATSVTCGSGRLADLPVRSRHPGTLNRLRGAQPRADSTHTASGGRRARRRRYRHRQRRSRPRSPGRPARHRGSPRTRAARQSPSSYSDVTGAAQARSRPGRGRLRLEFSTVHAAKGPRGRLRGRAGPPGRAAWLSRPVRGRPPAQPGAATPARRHIRARRGAASLLRGADAGAAWDLPRRRLAAPLGLRRRVAPRGLRAAPPPAQFRAGHDARLPALPHRPPSTSRRAAAA